MSEATTPIIEIKDVSKQFELQGQRIEALRDANLQLAKGEFVCLIGASGCGKSTCCVWSRASSARPVARI